jgi:multicomponent K+:H+ antiporter subunit E
VRTLLPRPLMSAVLFVMWLLLNQTMAPGPAVVGLIVALLGGWALSLLQTRRARTLPRNLAARMSAALRLSGLVLIDVARSNFEVAMVILNLRRNGRPCFMRIRLEMRDPRALAVLACILTATPGTAWMEFDSGEGWLLIHVLDPVDTEAWMRIVKDRYEKPLMEIFQ